LLGWEGTGGARSPGGTGAALMRRDHGVEDSKPAVCWQVPFLIPPVRCLGADGAVSWLLGSSMLQSQCGQQQP
jgi:hypothetical protein